MAQFFQPHVLLAALFAVSSRSSTTIPAASTGAVPQLTEEEMEKLKKFGRCYNCKQKRHAVWRCTQPTRPYLAVNAQLQKVKLVEEANAESKKE